MPDGEGIDGLIVESIVLRVMVCPPSYRYDAPYTPRAYPCHLQCDHSPDTMATNEERLKFHFIDDTEYIMGKLFN